MYVCMYDPKLWHVRGSHQDGGDQNNLAVFVKIIVYLGCSFLWAQRNCFYSLFILIMLQTTPVLHDCRV